MTTATRAHPIMPVTVRAETPLTRFIPPDPDDTVFKAPHPMTPEHTLIEDKALLERFVGPNAPHYLLSWDALQRRALSWNWSAFLFGDAWLFYRKMYGYGFLYTGLRIAFASLLISLPVLPDTLMEYDWLWQILMPHTLLMNLVLGLLADPLYQSHATRKLARARKIFSPDHVLLGAQTLGGVSVPALLWIPVLALLESAIPFLLHGNVTFRWQEMF